MQQIETIEPLFLERNFAQKITAQKVFRVNVGVGRHYRFEGGRTCKSLTTFLDAVMPSNRFLNTWRERLAADLGSAQSAEDYVQHTADYGTALHIAIAEYCREGGVNWAQFDRFAFHYLNEMGLKPDTIQSAQNELTRDFAALLQFFYDYRVQVIAVEIPVFIEEGIATLIDLVVEMDCKQYEKTPIEKRERQRAIINLKSGKKGFFETHLFQLEGERRMFNHTYGRAAGHIAQVYNLAPTDWKKEPSYKLKNQTEEIASQAIDYQFTTLLQLGRMRGLLSTPSRQFTVFTGRTDFGQSPTEAMRVMSYDEYTEGKMKAAKKPQLQTEDIF